MLQSCTNEAIHLIGCQTDQPLGVLGKFSVKRCNCYYLLISMVL